MSAAETHLLRCHLPSINSKKANKDALFLQTNVKTRKQIGEKKNVEKYRNPCSNDQLSLSITMLRALNARKLGDL